MGLRWRLERLRSGSPRPTSGGAKQVDGHTATRGVVGDAPCRGEKKGPRRSAMLETARRLRAATVDMIGRVARGPSAVMTHGICGGRSGAWS